MTTVHAEQALFLANQMVPCAVHVGLGFSTVSSVKSASLISVHDYIRIHQLVFKTWDIKSDYKWTQFTKTFF